MLPKVRISCENQEVREAERSRRPPEIIGTVGARLLHTKAHEREIKILLSFICAKTRKRE